MRSWDSVCPVCLRQGVEATPMESAVPCRNGAQMENRTHSDDAVLVQCPVCGDYVVTDCDRVNLRSERQRAKWDHLRLSALLREQTTRSLPPFWLQCGMDPYGPLERTELTPINVDELLRRWPRTVSERLDRTLCNLARLSPSGGDAVELTGNYEPLAFAKTEKEAQYHIRALLDRKDLKLGHASSGVVSDAVLTPSGWQRVEELTRGASAPENPIFVAMWFGGEDQKAKLDDAYQRGIVPAVERAGYRATRVDLVEHNEWIMDEVLAGIRLAHFVVADFTGHRNGVYFEAGFARGLGIPVIHTCEETELGKAHFDTQQLNHVLWTTPEELCKRLYHRIMNTIGRGPHPPPTATG